MGAWNLLRGEVVEADTIVTFKWCLDKYMNRMGIEGWSLEGSGVLVHMDSMVGAGLEGRRACSCAVIFFVLCFFVLIQVPHSG